MRLAKPLIVALVLSAVFSGTAVSGGTDATMAPSAGTPVDPDDKIKCRKIEVTGSLVKKGKVCKTVGEWKRIVENGNRTARAIMDSGKICSGGTCGNGN